MVQRTIFLLTLARPRINILGGASPSMLWPPGLRPPSRRAVVPKLPEMEALRATLSQRQRDIPGTGFQIENSMKAASVLLLERTASRNKDQKFLIWDVLCVITVDSALKTYRDPAGTGERESVEEMNYNGQKGR